MTPRVTVLTVVRNGADYIAETISTIVNQTFTDWEYVIIDDASEDETSEILARFAQREGRIRVARRSQRGGPYAAANEGLELARGRYVVRTDADDLSVPNRIERQLQYLAANEHLRACGSYWRLISASGEPYQSIRTIANGTRMMKWRLCVRGGPPHSTLCVERRAFQELGGYRELPVAQDYRLLCELARRDWLGIVPELLLYYRRHPAQMRSTANADQDAMGDEALRDHLQALGVPKSTWNPIVSIRRFEREPSGLIESLRSVSLWSRLWRADKELSASDREHLRKLTRDLRRRLIVATLRSPRKASIRRLRQMKVRG